MVFEHMDICNAMIASHNQETVEYVTALMDKKKINKSGICNIISGLYISTIYHLSYHLYISLLLIQCVGIVQAGVYFGQLLGMSDHLSMTLGKHKYWAYKYVPYGKIEEVIPYLLRRAEENSAFMAGSSSLQERRMLWEELKRRLHLL